MNLATILLYPIALLFPAVAGDDGGTGLDAAPVARSADDAATEYAASAVPGQGADANGGSWIMTFRSAEPESARQVRIEQRMTIRIAPRGAAPMMPDAFVAMEGMVLAPRYLERKIGRCLSMATIAGVQPQGGNRLLLFLRNGAMVAAELDRACRARDFYSGFYLASSSDGNLCVDRDKLLSRNGANCTLTQIRQLIEDRR